ncbi:SIP domain-containing protein [Roseateles sp.]|uniref:SIP domain-containing protein n=1 Tax=Roseateles sp. TaxID=1971397 RepID=UPI0025D7A9EC|nr:SIP domain-containing protein [Roseateles sp.]MBV8036919.1 SIP domain-containing protein [Roseateles sp.]
MPEAPVATRAVPCCFDTLLALAEALRALRLPSGEGFVWCAGEAQPMAMLRDILLREKGHPKAAMKVAAYWKAGATGYHARRDDDVPPGAG